MIRQLRAAVGFLTVLPVGGPLDQGLGTAWFPAVGLAVGLLAFAALGLVAALTTPLLGAVAGIATAVLVTGALHVDGLADAADGLFGGRTPERRLEIMRDPRVGSFGLVAVLLVLTSDVAALAGMDRWRALSALLTAGAQARLAMLVVLLALPYVRASGLGTLAGDRRPLRDLALAVPVAALPLLLDWRRGVLAAVLVALTAFGIATLARRRIGGVTGDVYGSVLEVGQLAALTAFAVRL